MKKSIEKLIQLVGLFRSESEFAETLGYTKGKLNKYINRALDKEFELRTDIALDISKIHKIDFYYFYNDLLPVSSNPAKDYPVVDSQRVSELEKTVDNLANQVGDLLKNTKESNSGIVKMLAELADSATTEFITATIKLSSVLKQYSTGNTDFEAIMDVSNKVLVNYANSKALDFKQMILKVNPSNAKENLEILQKIVEFKAENAKYYVQVDTLIECINKNKILIEYENLLLDLDNDLDSIVDKQEAFEDKCDDESIIHYLYKNFDNSYADFVNIINYSKAFLFRDIISCLEIKEMKKVLTPMLKNLFYEDNQFDLSSNPNTLERMTESFVQMVNEEDYLKVAYQRVLDSIVKNNKLIEECEKKAGIHIC